MNDFFYGLYYPFKCLKVLLKNKRLLKLSILPVLINLLIYGSIFILIYRWAIVKSEQLTGADSINSLWWQEVLNVLVVIISFFVIVIFCYFIFLFLSGLITAPFNEKISQVSEEIITGETLVSDRSFYKDLYWSSRDELIKLSFYFLVIFIFFLIGFIPLIGGIFSTIFGFLFSVFFCALDFLDYPMARNLLPLKKKISIVSRGGMLTFGFGLTSFVFMFIPFLNVFTKPLLVISGTILYFNKFEKKKRYIKMEKEIEDLNAAKELGLNEEEYSRILKILGRTPTFTELGIFSVMWSEHCSYKNSILQIKTLPRSGGKLLVSAGEENAGLVDIGDGLAVAFKIESHNHPSAVEPYQGAATGVGGILRDIFTMGARPIAALNSLRFGKITTGDESSERSKFLFKNVVKGIGDYGNCFGVPTISGEVYFEECYQDNPLVNAMAVGIVKHGETATATSSGVGNPVFIVGSSTGKDGIHGATFASEEISEKSESKRPSVQVGDPFTEKLLLEASLEAIKSGAVVGIQDMGAAGITCSSSEMSAKGNCGMEINLDLVPLRDKSMSAYEIMLSESQERMLVVVEKGKEEIAKKIFSKWDLNCIQVGNVIEENKIKIHYKNKLEADVPASELVLGGGAPVYKRDVKEPEYLKETRNFDSSVLTEPKDLNQVLLKLLGSPNIANKNWVYQQYDTQVRTNTSVMPGGDASVIRIKKSDKALSLKVDCNSKYVYLNPYKGGMIAVCESARNVACTGGIPLAITNCLNFGDPYNPEMYYQFTEAVRGIGDACRFLGTPVTGGNVSFYNLSKDYAVFPTPVIGMLGLIEDYRKTVTSNFKKTNDLIYLIGNKNSEIGGSEYLNLIHNILKGDAPDINLQSEKRLIDVLIELSKNNLINSAHDLAEGGLAVALAESCIMNRFNKIGVDVDIEFENRKDFELFGESQSRVIISAEIINRKKIEDLFNKFSVPFKKIGVTSEKHLKINSDINIEIEELENIYFNSIEKILM